jgi:hypothetical protein
MVEATFVCGLTTCNDSLPPGSREVLCPRHLAMIGRPVPRSLEKTSSEAEEVDARDIARRVEEDAWPLFLVALAWCVGHNRQQELDRIEGLG